MILPEILALLEGSSFQLAKNLTQSVINEHFVKKAKILRLHCSLKMKSEADAPPDSPLNVERENYAFAIVGSHDLTVRALWARNEPSELA